MKVSAWSRRYRVYGFELGAHGSRVRGNSLTGFEGMDTRFQITGVKGIGYLVSHHPKQKIWRLSGAYYEL